MSLLNICNGWKYACVVLYTSFNIRTRLNILYTHLYKYVRIYNNIYASIIHMYVLYSYIIILFAKTKTRTWATGSRFIVFSYRNMSAYMKYFYLFPCYRCTYDT